MNFLAHIYLSGNSREVLIGNFIGDYVKGRDYTQYAPEVQKGILLHRHIDSFTDRHPVTLSSKRRVSDRYGKYAGIVVDIFYDHFLASGWDSYSDQSLSAFVNDKYQILDSGFSVFPRGVKNWFPYFIRTNWLETYVSVKGLEKVFKRMSYRSSLPDHSVYAVHQLEEHYEELKSGFTDFFDEICGYVRDEYDIRLAGTGSD